MQINYYIIVLCLDKKYIQYKYSMSNIYIYLPKGKIGHKKYQKYLKPLIYKTLNITQFQARLTSIVTLKVYLPHFPFPSFLDNLSGFQQNMIKSKKK